MALSVCWSGCRPDTWGIGILFSMGKKVYCSPQRPDGLWAHPIFYLVDTVIRFPRGVKRERREANLSPPSGVEVKNTVEVYLHSPGLVHGVLHD
jgi:hypothetical protein